MQKIKGKNMIQAIEGGTSATQIYSKQMKEILKLQNAIIEIQPDYIIVLNSEEKKYIDNDGKQIQDTSSLKITSFPDQIGEYQKAQATLEMVYYTK